MVQNPSPLLQRRRPRALALGSGIGGVQAARSDAVRPPKAGRGYNPKGSRSSRATVIAMTLVEIVTTRATMPSSIGHSWIPRARFSRASAAPKSAVLLEGVEVGARAPARTHPRRASARRGLALLYLDLRRCRRNMERKNAARAALNTATPITTPTMSRRPVRSSGTSHAKSIQRPMNARPERRSPRVESPLTPSTRSRSRPRRSRPRQRGVCPQKAPERESEQNQVTPRSKAESVRLDEHTEAECDRRRRRSEQRPATLFSSRTGRRVHARRSASPRKASTAPRSLRSPQRDSDRQAERCM